MVKLKSQGGSEGAALGFIQSEGEGRQGIGWKWRPKGAETRVGSDINVRQGCST